MIITEPMLTDLDEPRARSTDPLASHLAGDRSQRGLSDLRIAALRMLAKEGPMTGAVANRVYRKNYMNGATWPYCADDSIRKRLGEMADEDKGGIYVDVVAHNHGTLEAVYAISPEGRRYLEGLDK